MEGKTIIQSFTDHDDAYYFFDQHVREHASDWELQQGSGIQYINYQWRVGLSWEKKIEKKDDQLVLPDLTNLMEDPIDNG